MAHLKRSQGAARRSCRGRPEQEHFDVLTLTAAPGCIRVKLVAMLDLKTNFISQPEPLEEEPLLGPLQGRVGYEL